MTALRILNWNVQADQQTSSNGRGERILKVLREAEADVICLTESYGVNFPAEGHIIQSESSGWGWPEARGARKVGLWSKTPWEQVNTVGSHDLPEGRYISAVTQGIRFIGVVIPYHAYRSTAKWGEQRKTVWQGAQEYLIAFQKHILSTSQQHERTVILGDFNLQIPARGYPGKRSEVNRLREATFAGWQIPTSGEIDDPRITKPFIDHVALTPDLTVSETRYISRLAEDGSVISDHNGVVIDLKLRQV